MVKIPDGYVLVPRYVTGRSIKGIDLPVDLLKFGAAEDHGAADVRGTFLGRCVKNLGSDAVSDAKWAAGAEATRAHLLATRERWYTDPEGGTRGPIDPFLNEMRAFVIRARIMTTTDARAATLDGIRAVVGEARWDAAVRLVDQAIADAAAFAAVVPDEPAAPADEKGANTK